MASASPHSDRSGGLPEDSERKVELALALWIDPEDYRDEDGEINEDLMYQEALTYAAEAAEQDEFDVTITRTVERSERPSKRRDEQDTGTCPICESTARQMRNDDRFICDGCARCLNPDEVCDS